MIDFSVQPLVETAWLAEHLLDIDLCIVDARWRGDSSSRELYRVGHIPGALHWHASTTFNPTDWTHLPSGILREYAYEKGIYPEQRVITYCGVGISASQGLFALYLAGYRNLALYDASWEEWGTNMIYPVEREE